MNKINTFLLLCLLSANGWAQKPWKLSLIDSKEKIEIHIDLHEESIEVPGMEMFGLMNGYVAGNIYRVWSVTSFKIKDNKTATIRVSNDLGSETQEIKITQKNDSIWDVDLVGHNVIKRVKGNKLIKIPTSYQMKKAQ